jgi:K+-transporting ATPase KdpF subunit
MTPRLRRRGATKDWNGESMAFIMAAIIAMLLLAYLVYAMFHPEKFE